MKKLIFAILICCCPVSVIAQLSDNVQLPDSLSQQIMLKEGKIIPIYIDSLSSHTICAIDTHHNPDEDWGYESWIVGKSQDMFKIYTILTDWYDASYPIIGWVKKGYCCVQVFCDAYETTGKLEDTVMYKKHFEWAEEKYRYEEVSCDGYKGKRTDKETIVHNKYLFEKPDSSSSYQTIQYPDADGLFEYPVLDAELIPGERHNWVKVSFPVGGTEYVGWTKRYRINF